MAWLSLALVGMCCLLILWLWHSDLGQLKPQLTARLTEYLQREVQVEGPLSIRLGHTVVIKAGQLRVANPPWAQQRWLLSSETLELHLQLRSLFSGPLIVERLQLGGLSIAAERAEDGRESWVFANTVSGQASTDDSKGLVLRHIMLEDARLDYQPGGKAKPLLIAVEELVQTQGRDDMLSLELRGKLNQQILQYSGRLGPFDNLVTGVDVQFDGAGRLGGLSVQGSGTIDKLRRPRYPVFHGRVQGASLSELEQLLPANSLPDIPYRLNVDVTPAAQRLSVSIEAQAESLSLDIKGSSRELLAIDDLDYSFDITGEQLAAWASLFGQQGLPSLPFNAIGRFTRLGSRVGFEQVLVHVGDARLALDGDIANYHEPRNSQLDLQVSGPEIGHFRMLSEALRHTQGPFAATLKLAPGSEGPDAFAASITLPLITANITGRFGPGPAYAGTRMHLQASGPEFGDLATPLNLGVLPEGEFQLDAQLGVGDGELELGPGSVLKVAENQLEARGVIGLSAANRSTSLQFSVTGNRAQALVQPYHQIAIPAGDFSVSGRYQPSATQQRFDQLAFDFAGVRGGGELVLDAPFDGSSLKFALQAQAADARSLVPASLREKLLSNPLNARIDGAVKAGVWTFTDSQLQLGPASLELDGTLGRLPDLSTTHFDLRFAAPRLNALLVLPEGPLTATPLSLNTRFTGSPQVFELADLSLQVGDSDLQGSGSVSLAEQPPRLDVTLHSRMLDLSMVQSVPSGAALQAPAVTQATRDRAIPDIAFPMDQLQRVNARFALSADQLRTPFDILSATRLHGSIQNGALHIERLHVEGLEGFADGSFSLVTGPDGLPTLSADVKVHGMVPNLGQHAGTGSASLPAVNVELLASGQGAGLRSFAASLNGHFSAQGGAGVIPGSLLSLLDAGLLRQIMRAVIPASGQHEDTQLRCFATRLDFVDGQVQAAPGVALITDRMHLVSNGTINLVSEALDLNIKATPAKARQANVSEVLINPFVRIGGTIKAPKMEVDAERALVFGGAAAATAGLSIVATGLFNRLKTAKDPCAEYLDNPE